MKRPYALASLAVLLVLLAGAVARLHWSAGRYVEEGRIAEFTNPQLAALWYGEAMRAYVPLWHPYFTEAGEALRSLAGRAEATEDWRTALDSWREVNASLHAVRSLYQPYPGLLAESEKEIERLEAKIKEAPPPAASPAPAPPPPPPPASAAEAPQKNPS